MRVSSIFEQARSRAAGPTTYTITTQLLNVENDQAVINNLEAEIKKAFPGATVARELIGQQISQ